MVLNHVVEVEGFASESRSLPVDWNMEATIVSRIALHGGTGRPTGLWKRHRSCARQLASPKDRTLQIYPEIKDTTITT